jgi:hypothetical protein
MRQLISSSVALRSLFILALAPLGPLIGKTYRKSTIFTIEIQTTRLAEPAIGPPLESK